MDWPVCGEVIVLRGIGFENPEGIYLEMLIGLLHCSVKICCFCLFSHLYLNCTNRWHESKKTGQDKLEGLM